MAQQLPHNVLGKQIFDLMTAECIRNGYSPDVAIHALLSALQSFANNNNAEHYTIGVMNTYANIMDQYRDAKIEAQSATLH